MNNIILIEIYIENIPNIFFNKLKNILFNKILLNNFIINNIYYNDLNIFYSSSRITFIFKGVYFNKNYYMLCNKINLINDKILFYKNKKILINKNGFFIIKTKYICINIKINNILTNTLTKFDINDFGVNWDKKNNFSFIRPIRNIIVFINNNFIKLNLLNISNNLLFKGNKNIKYKLLNIENIQQYYKIIKNKGKIILDYEKRKIRVYRIIKNKLKNIKGYVNIKNNKILTNNLLSLEYPNIHFIKIKFIDNYIFNKIFIYIINNKFKCLNIFCVNDNNILLDTIIYIGDYNNNKKNKNILEEKIRNNINIYFNDILNIINFDLIQDINIDKLNKIYLIGKKFSLYDKIIRLKNNVIFIYNIINNYYYIYNNNYLLNIIDSIYIDKFYLLSNLSVEYNDIHYLICEYYSKKKKKSIIISNLFSNIYNIKKKNIFNDKNNIIYYIYILSDELDNLLSIIINDKNYTNNIKNDYLYFRRSLNIVINILINNEINIPLHILISKNLFLFKLNSYSDNIYISNLLNKIIIDKFYKICVKKYKMDKNIINRLLSLNKNLSLNNINLKITSFYIFWLKNKKNIEKIFLLYKRINNLMLKNNILENNKNYILNNDFIKTKIEKRIVYKLIIFKIEKYYFDKTNNIKHILNNIYELIKLYNIFLNRIKLNKNKKYMFNRILLLKEIQYIIKSYIHI